MNNSKERFSIVKRAESVANASRGIWVCLKSTHNAWIHIVVFILVLLAGWFFCITKIEWLFVIIVSGFVFTAEAFNTAIEIDMDLTSPEIHPYARDTKDVAAGAVLLSTITAVAVGLIVFLPYIYKMFI